MLEFVEKRHRCVTRPGCREDATLSRTDTFPSVDAAPVHILFTVIRPERGGDQHDPEQHLEMMRWIARLSRDADFRRFATRVKTKTELVDLLKEMSAV